MRRKKLLLAMCLVFFLSSYGISALLGRLNLKPKPTYISIAKWGTPEDVEVPHTGEDIVSVLSPRTVAEMAWPGNPANSTAEDNYSQNLVQSAHLETLHVESETTTKSHDLTFGEICGEVILLLLGVGVVILLGYLTYQHFRR